MASHGKTIYIILRRVFIFAILVFVLDYIIGCGIEYFYFKQKTGLYARTTYGLQQTTADVLIFGSSSAIHHYDPTVFEDSLNLTAYNQGRDGIDILYHAAILKGILNRYSPNTVVLNLSPYELSTALSYDRLSALLPYTGKYPEMTETIELKSKYEKWKLFSKIYPFNSTFLTIMKGFRSSEGKKKSNKGYVPLYNSIDTNNFIAENFSIHYPADPNRVKALRDFINLCTEKDISVFVFFSPVYQFDDEKTETIDIALKIANEEGATCMNFMNDPRFKGNTTLFKDNGHMNHVGATKYSQIVVSSISTVLHGDNLPK